MHGWFTGVICWEEWGRRWVCGAEGLRNGLDLLSSISNSKSTYLCCIIMIFVQYYAYNNADLYGINAFYDLSCAGALCSTFFNQSRNKNISVIERVSD